MSFQNISGYTHSDRSSAQWSRPTNTVSECGSHSNNANQQFSGISSFQGNNLLSAFMEMAQNLLKQLQSNPQQNTADTPVVDTGDAASAGNQTNFLTLSAQQRSNLQAGVANLNSDNAFIVDKDCSGTVSKGDVLKTHYAGFGGDPMDSTSLNYDVTLRANDAALINGKFGSALTLSDADKARLQSGLNTSATTFNQVFDRDGSGTISSGDVAIGSTAGAFGGTPPPKFPTSYVTLDVASDGTISRKPR